MTENTSQFSDTQKLNEILRRLEVSPEASLHNIEVLNERILGDVIDIRKKVDRLEISVIIGNGEPPLKEQVHGLHREIKNTTFKLDCHIDEDKKRIERTVSLWEKIALEFLRILPGLLLAYLLVTFGLK